MDTITDIDWYLVRLFLDTPEGGLSSRARQQLGASYQHQVLGNTVVHASLHRLQSFIYEQDECAPEKEYKLFTISSLYYDHCCISSE